MQKRNKNISIKKILVVASFVLLNVGIVLFGSASVSSEGNAGLGTYPTGGQCYWWGTCEGTHGATWAAYDLSRDIDTPVNLSYSSHVPKVSIVGCKKNMTLYNYGFIAINDSDSIAYADLIEVSKSDKTEKIVETNSEVLYKEVKDSDKIVYEDENIIRKYRFKKIKLLAPHTTTGQQVGTIARTASHNYEIGKYSNGTIDEFKGVYNGGNNTFTSSYYHNAGYVQEYVVKSSYDTMKAYDGVNGTNYTNGTTWDNVGWFCFRPDAIYYNTSVARTNKDTSAELILVNGKGYEKTETINGIKVGDTVEINFYHDVYTDMENNKYYKWSVINEAYKTENNSKVAVVADKDVKYDDRNTHDNNATVGNGECNVDSSNKSKDGKFVCHDVSKRDYDKTFKVKVLEGGNYSFCQTLKLDVKLVDSSNALTTVNTTKVCIDFNVESVASEIKSQTSATATGVTSTSVTADTGIVQNGTKTTNLEGVKTNEVVTITFKSDLFASKEQSTPVAWSAEVTASKKTGYTVNSWLSKNVKSTLSAPSNFDWKNIGASNKLSKQSGNYFIANSSNPVLENTIKLVFNATGTYRFCQQIGSSLDETNTATKACVNVTVGDEPPIVIVECTCAKYLEGECNNPVDAPCIDEVNDTCTPTEKYLSRDTATHTFGENTSTSTVTGSNGNSGTLIYVKPNDTIAFKHCFYPAVQVVRSNHDGDSNHQLTAAQDATLPKDITGEGPKWSAPSLSATFEDTIGERETISANSNYFNVNTTNLSAIKERRMEYDSNFVVSGAQYATFTGIKGDDKIAYANTSNTLTANPLYVGQIITQDLKSDYVTISLTPTHNQWSKTWDFKYRQAYSFTNSMTIAKYYKDDVLQSGSDSDSDVDRAVSRYESSYTGTNYYNTRIYSTYTGSSSSTYTSCSRYGWVEKVPEEEVELDEDGNPVIVEKPKEYEYVCVEEHHHETTYDYYRIDGYYEMNLWAIGNYIVYHQNNDPVNNLRNYLVQPVRTYSSAPMSSASVYIPYNYISKAKVDLQDDKIYAGEKFGITDITVDTEVRTNNVTHGTYATKTPKEHIKLYVFATDYDISGHDGTAYANNHGDCNFYTGQGYYGCAERYQEYNQAFNTNGNMNGATDEIANGFHHNSSAAYDLRAGSYMCVGASIWPAESNGDMDMTDSGNGITYYSAPVCRKVYKKPSFEVWGGGIFSNGNIVASQAQKANLSYTMQDVKDITTEYFFSSWVEGGIIANRKVSNVSSGAGTGYTTNSSGTIAKTPGGARATSSFCKLSTLTIPNNYICSNGSSYVKAEIPSTKNNSFTSIYDAVIDKKPLKNASGTITLNNANVYTEENGTRYTKLASNSVISYSNLEKAKTHVVYSEGNIIIGGNLTYPNDAYTSASQVSQYIIYASGNINISCNVTWIDAMLIAEGSIDTCYDGGSYDSAARSVQLRINGSIITDKLNLTRTYGAAQGMNSGVPAEIINFSLTTRFFGKNEASDSPTLYTVYLKELSPRY